MSPVEKAGHRGPHPAATGGARIAADLEARLAIEAQRQTPQWQMQRAARAPAAHGVHDLPTPVAAHWLLTAGQDALVRSPAGAGHAGGGARLAEIIDGSIDGPWPISDQRTEIDDRLRQWICHKLST